MLLEIDEIATEYNGEKPKKRKSKNIINKIRGSWRNGKSKKNSSSATSKTTSDHEKNPVTIKKSVLSVCKTMLGGSTGKQDNFNKSNCFILNTPQWARKFKKV